jgi:hypothetical protein
MNKKSKKQTAKDAKDARGNAIPVDSSLKHRFQNIFSGNLINSNFTGAKAGRPPRPRPGLPMKPQPSGHVRGMPRRGLSASPGHFSKCPEIFDFANAQIAWALCI